MTPPSFLGLIFENTPVLMRAIMAALTALLLSWILGPRIIRYLLSLKVGQPLRTADEVHKLAELHGGKIGTPTMGGLLILGTTTTATLLFTSISNSFIWLCLVSMLLHGVLGFCDDFKKVKEKKSGGISSKTKLFWQLVIALGIAAALACVPQISSNYTIGHQNISPTALFIPFTGKAFPLGIAFYPFIIITIIACSNAVNLTDGLDGLASGCTIATSKAYAFIALLAAPIAILPLTPSIPTHPLATELVVFLSALIGACFGFIWFNGHPAKVFMGDTGSLAIGGALGTVAVCLKQELLFIIVGGVFFAEASSVLLQTTYYKLTKKPNAEGKLVGKRIFRMAPLHHHFELGGIHESQVIIRFWIISILLAILGVTIICHC